MRPHPIPRHLSNRLCDLLALAALIACTVSFNAAQAAPRLERLDPRLDALIAADAVAEKIIDDHDWVEGPVWASGRVSDAFDDAAHFLLYTDIPRNAVYRWSPDGGDQLFLRPSGYSGSAPFRGREPGANGLTLDPQGRLVLAEHGDRRISRLAPDGRKATLVDRYQGHRLNSPNDVVFDRAGNLYFTDPPFGLPRQFDDPARELDFCGVYRLTPAGRLTLLSGDIQAPNGIALSPAEDLLYVTDVGQRRPAWWAFPLRPDGTLGQGRVFRDAAEFAGNGPGGPDGLKVDRHGNLFASGPGGVYIFAPEGALLGRVDLGVATSNLAWGEDGRTLFITADHALYRLRTRSGRAP